MNWILLIVILGLSAFGCWILRDRPRPAARCPWCSGGCHPVDDAPGVLRCQVCGISFSIIRASEEDRAA